MRMDGVCARKIKQIYHMGYKAVKISPVCVCEDIPRFKRSPRSRRHLSGLLPRHRHSLPSCAQAPAAWPANPCTRLRGCASCTKLHSGINVQ